MFVSYIPISLANLRVRRALGGIVSGWDDLGEVLGLPHQEVKSIKMNHSKDVKECLKEVIEKWLEGKGSGEPPSWKSLCQALRDPLVSRPDVASMITVIRAVCEKEDRSYPTSIK